MPKLSREAVSEIAKYAGLELDESELDELQPQIEGLLAGLEKLNELPLKDVEPATIFTLQPE
ncbi:MAG: aspartyl/glutamyl-tRNA amidotransferase subunit C [Chloroflexi bacterium]|nr:aspartyl/glutamyl-tRNA amidotransferase subunit C [Chloroflexota bacterium]